LPEQRLMKTLVVLHELVHTIQNDGAGTTPGWLIESIPDHLRLLAHLDPPHWRKAGDGRKDKGWEEGYDAGARFLAWLTGEGEESDTQTQSQSQTHAHTHPPPSYDDDDDVGGIQTEMSRVTLTGPPKAQPTKYLQSQSGESRKPSTGKGKGKSRRGPFKELVRSIDARLKVEQWDDMWWEEMTGAELEVLWKEYLDYYA